jgi:hypothetical protein
MWLWVLILHSGSNRPDFVTVDGNHKISLSPEAVAIIRNSSQPFLILLTGRSGSGKSFFGSNLLRGPWNDAFDPGEFESDDGGPPVTKGFPFHPGITVAEFCKKWGIECDPDLANRTIVVIDSQGDGVKDELRDEIIRTALGLSPIIFLRIHVTAPDRSETGDWQSVLDGMGLNSEMVGKAVTHGLLIVVSRIGVPKLPRNASDADYIERMRWQDDWFTERLHCNRQLGMRHAKKSAVFLQPEAARRPKPYWYSMRGIAQFIVDLIRQTPPMPPEDAFALFGAAAKWLEKQGDDFGISLDRHFVNMAGKRMMKARIRIVREHVARTQQELAEGPRAFELKIHSKVEEVVSNATAAFHSAFLALPERWRDVFREKDLKSELAQLQSALRSEIPPLLKKRRMELKTEFSATCSREYHALLNEACDYIGWSTIWRTNIDRTYLLRFEKAVRYSEFPPAGQRALKPVFDDYCERLVNEIRQGMTVQRNGFVTAAGVVFNAAGPVFDAVRKLFGKP